VKKEKQTPPPYAETKLTRQNSAGLDDPPLAGDTGKLRRGLSVLTVSFLQPSLNLTKKPRSVLRRAIPPGRSIPFLNEELRLLVIRLTGRPG
jgi:hypothetical protein